MKSLKIVFEASGARIVLDDIVEGFDAVTQNGLVNIATEKGSAPTEPDRGTNLLRDALEGKVASLLDAQHISNLASLDTLFYLRGTDEIDTLEERLESLVLKPFDYDGESVRINAVFNGSQGTVIGKDITL
jgi:hypothetical protein